MAKVKAPEHWTGAHYVPWLMRDVEPGEVVEVPDGDLPSYVEGGWEKAAEPRNKVKEH